MSLLLAARIERATYLRAMADLAHESRRPNEGARRYAAPRDGPP
ncbi:hypothetical protein ACFV29_10950 [Streptomyces sp. NPDC059690]